METQKDELLNLHRSIVDSSAKLNNGLKVALHDSAMDSARNKESMEAVQEQQKRLLAEMEETDLRFRDTFIKLLHEVKTGIDTVMAAFTSSLSNIRNETADLEKVTTTSLLSFNDTDYRPEHCKYFRSDKQSSAESHNIPRGRSVEE